MGERKGVNKYYPPDFDPRTGGLDKLHGTHPLRERARKLHEGILIIRFEMPYNIWCSGCGNHVGMGVRYNAQKKKVGYYYTTPIYKFRMKCHLCDNHYEIQTDPKNCEYVIVSGAKRKEERWDPAVTENIQTTDHNVKAKLVSDAMFKLEHSVLDQQKAKKSAPTLGRLRNIQDAWKDDFSINQALRQKFRHEKKEISNKKMLDDELKTRALLPAEMPLVDETAEDAGVAKRIRYGQGDVRPDLKSKARSREIRRSSIFEKKSDSKGKLARLFIAQAHQSNVSTFITQPVKAGSKNVGVITKRTVAKEDSKELVLRGDLVDDVARSGGNDSINNDDAVQRLDNFTSTEGISCDLAESPAVTNSGTSKSGIAPGGNSSLIVTYSSSSSDCSD